MTVGTFAVTEAVPHRSRAVAQSLSLVTRRALESIVSAFERIFGEPFVIEAGNLERLGGVARIALAFG